MLHCCVAYGRNEYGDHYCWILLIRSIRQSGVTLTNSYKKKLVAVPMYNILKTDIVITHSRLLVENNARGWAFMLLFSFSYNKY